MRNNQGVRKNKCFPAYWLPLPILTCTSPKQEHRNTCMVQQIYLQIMTHKCTSRKVRGNSVTFYLSLFKLHPAAFFLFDESRFVWWEKLSSIPNATNRYSQNPCARKSRFVSIKVKCPHALIECKEILIRNVSRDQYFVQS